MKFVAASLFALMTLVSQAGTVCHIFETNSIAGTRRFHPYSAQAVKMIPIPNYVTNGLTHWYDGVHNNGKGFHKSGKLNFWKDVQGSNDLYITSTQNAEFLNNSLYFSFNKSGYQYVERTEGICVNDQIPDSDIVTIEICAGTYKVSAYSVPQTDMDMLCAQGSSMSTQYTDPYYSCPFWIGFTAMMGSGASSHTGDPYWTVVSRGDDMGWRGTDFTSYYDQFPGNRTYKQFTISVSCTDRSQTSANLSQSYYQPFYTATSSIFYDFSSRGLVAITNSTAVRYDTAGRVSNTSSAVNKLYVHNHELQIGGIRYGLVKYGLMTYRESSFWTGYIYSVRIYNRKLTDAEKMINAQIDRERFYNIYD